MSGDEQRTLNRRVQGTSRSQRSAFLKPADSSPLPIIKLIKDYLRSTISEERLSDLAMLSIENEHARKLEISNFVDSFVPEKALKRII